MDFSELSTANACEQGAWMDLRAPCDLTLPDGRVIKRGEAIDDGNGPTRLKVLGRDSAKFRQVSHRVKRQAMQDAIRYKDDPAKMPSQDDYSLESLAELVIDAEHYEVKGKPLKCTPKNVLKEFDRNPWVADQVDRFSARLENYLGEPSRPSRTSSNATPGAKGGKNTKR